MAKRPSRPSPPLSRRRILQGLGAAIGGAAIGGCGSDDAATKAGSSSAASSTASGTSGTGGAGGGTASSSTASTTATTVGNGGSGGAGGGDSCVGNGGLTSAELLAQIDTFVVLCMENRSFDHFVGSRKLKEGLPVDGLTGGETNLDPNGVAIPIFKLNNYTVESPPHDWDPVHQQWDNGSNDGFVVAHAGPHEQEVMGYHVREQLPITYALADGAVLCDRYFASVLGPTWPNRFYLHGATSKGTKGNTPVTGFTSLFDLLDNAGITNRNYYSDIPWCSTAYFKVGGLSGIEQFFTDAQNGMLPQFSLIDPTFFGGMANDDHPDHDVELGQALIGSVFKALAASPQWGRCLFILTYDEHGGFFDHVAPPPIVDDDPDFANLGIRVPTIVAGPFVKQGCVIGTTFDHVSIIKTLTERYGLPSLNQRVDATNDLSDVIDPNALDAPKLPPNLPPVEVSMSKVRARRPRGIDQPEMLAVAELGLLPRHLDRRARSAEITELVLAEGERLGAVIRKG